MTYVEFGISLYVSEGAKRSKRVGSWNGPKASQVQPLFTAVPDAIS